MERRRFVVHLGGMAVLVTVGGACSGGDGDGGGPTPTPTFAGCTTGAEATSITGNHGHSVNISQADVTAGDPNVYSIMGGATHDHTIAVSAADFLALKAGDSVQITSSFDGHQHTVTLACS